MLGNVNEWCQDAWHPNYQGAPVDGSAWTGSPEPVEHVARGVAAYVIASACSSGARISQNATVELIRKAMRMKSPNKEQYRSRAFELYGLRLVCEPIPDDVNT